MKKYTILSEFSDFTPIPSYFTKQVKQLKKNGVMITWSMNLNKNYFYKFFMKNKA